MTSTGINPINVLASMEAIDGWAREVSDQYIDSEEGMRADYANDLRASREARAAVAELIEAGGRLTAAFRALGESRDISAQVKRHVECESAMVSFDAVLTRVKGDQP